LYCAIVGRIDNRVFWGRVSSEPGEVSMPYFTRAQSRAERRSKVFADTVVGALLLIFSIAFFGTLGGLLAWVILEAALLSVDYLVPSSDDDTPGVAVR
jgi:hypothetical protein